MAGTYLEHTSKDLSGVYTLIVAVLEYVVMGARGIVAYPFTANWGPCNDLTIVLYGSEFDAKFNPTGSTAVTANKISALAFKGKPQKILAYRMATTDAKKGQAILNDAQATPQMSLTLETLYESDRSFVVTIKDSLNIEGGKMLELTENGNLLFRTESGTLDDLATKIDYSDYIRVKSKGTQLPANNAGVSFTGGSNGAVVTSFEYDAFLDTIEADGTCNAFSLDSVTDETIIAMVVTFVKRVRDEGFYTTFVRGGPQSWDTNLDASGAAAFVCNHRGIVCVGNGVDGYTAADMAIFIAARVASVPLNRTLTDEVVDFVAVNKKLKPGERVTAKLNGTLVFVADGKAVVIDEGINTLTVPHANEVKEMGKIRINNTLDQIAHDLEVFGNEYKKSLSNTDAARKTYAATVTETYYKGLVAMEVLQPGATYTPDPEYHGKDAVFHPKVDEAFFVSDIQPVDSMEKIYQKMRLHF
jgi:hypothetical protein